MNLWLRLLGFFVAVALAAFVLKELPPLVFIAGVVAGGSYAWWRVRSRREDEQKASGVAALGLQRADDDPFGLIAFPLALLARGTDRVVENVTWGRWHGRELRAFELRYSLGPEMEQRRFICAMVGIDYECPALVIEPVTFLTPPAEQGDLREVGSGSVAFDRVFGVRGDAAFARALVDDRMREWLLGLGEDRAFELNGRLAACYAARVSDDVMPVLLALGGFLDRIPKVALGAGAAAPPVVPESPDGT